jgi:succinate dehydrogenase / fumarate reductase flavoprotein subunit
VVRRNSNLARTDAKLLELLDRYTRISLADRTKWSNQTLNFARELYNMLILARVITLGALARNESRGAHYKPEFPERDDKNWLRTTRAVYECGKIRLEYDPVDTLLIPPRPRRYDVAA